LTTLGLLRGATLRVSRLLPPASMWKTSSRRVESHRSVSWPRTRTLLLGLMKPASNTPAEETTSFVS
jgi:hypothetical protein